MSNTNTEVLTTAYEKLQGAITQANTVLPELEEAVEKGNLDNYATTSDLEDITNIINKIPYSNKERIAYSSLLKKLNDGTIISICCQGDSLTYGQDTKSTDKRVKNSDPTLESGIAYSGHTQASKTYPEAMQGYLQNIFGTDKITVLNRGWSGDTAVTSKNHWKTNPNCDITFLQLGTNDASQGTVDSYFLNMLSLVQQILDFNTFLVLLTPPKKGMDKDFELESFRNVLHTIGSLYGIPVIDTDMFLEGYDTSDVMSDDIHYNGTGYSIHGAKVATVFMSLINIYNPYILKPNNAYYPNMLETICYKKGSNMFGHTLSGMGVENAKTKGIVAEIKVGQLISLSFYADRDNLVLFPLDNSISNGNIEYKLDFGITQSQFISAYTFNKTSRSDINKTIVNTISRTGNNISTELDYKNSNNIFILPKKGWYNITIKNSATEGICYWAGFIVKDYNELLYNDRNFTSVQRYLTHPDMSSTEDVTTSDVNLQYDFNIEYDSTQYWKNRPLKLTVYNYDNSILEYLIIVGQKSSGIGWNFKLRNRINIADNPSERTLSTLTVTFDPITIHLNWAGETTKPTAFWIEKI